MRRLIGLAAFAALLPLAVYADEPPVDGTPSSAPAPAPHKTGKEAPYARLAADLGTPDLAYSVGTKDKSQLDLHFVRPGQSYQHWTKMTSVSILKVKPVETAFALRTVIGRLRAHMNAHEVHLIVFEKSSSPSGPTAFYHFTTKHENDAGIVYSPTAGFVSVIGVSVFGNKETVGDDAKILKKVAGFTP